MKNALLTIALLCICTAGYPQINWEEIDPGTNDGIHDIEITPNGTLFIYTYGTGKILRSSDKGESWEIAANLDSIYFEQIQFIDDKHGWICGEQGKIYKTIDGGQIWLDRSIAIDAGNLLLYGMWFEDKLNGMVSGAILKDRKLHNKIYFTEDGGSSWNEMTDFKSPSMILNLEKSPADLLWGSGDNMIVKNEHDSWNIMFYDSTKTTGQIRDLLFIDDHTIVAVSFKGKIIRSADGGQTWKNTPVTKNRLRSLALLHDGSLITAGDQNKENGQIFISNDAGISWTPWENNLEDVHRIQVFGSSCWLVGKNGMIGKISF